MAHVVRECDDGKHCFATIRLDSGERVMVSIAWGDVRIMKMSWGGIWPAETLWKSSNADEIAATFFNGGSPTERPLVSIRNAFLNCQSTDEVRTL